MRLFGDKRTYEQRQREQQERLEEFMEKYQLEDLDEKDMVVLEKIANDLIRNSLMKTGMNLPAARTEDQLKVTYLSALIEQNWMIIRQLSRLNNNIEKLNNKQEI